MPITEKDVEAMQIKETSATETEPASSNFISFLRQQDSLHQKNLRFMKQYENTLATKAIYTGIPEAKQAKLMQTL